jgi:ketosteroid isomerase-like protein
MRDHRPSGAGLVPLFLGVLVLCVCPATGKGQGVEAAAEVEAREIAFAKTMADRDLDAFATFISPEAIFFAGNEPLEGREVIVQAWAAFFEGPTAPFSWHPDLVEVLESGGLAISSGPVLDASGAEVGRFNSIWRKDADGQWRVVFDKGS